MKKTIIKITALSIGIFMGFSAFAQQATGAKPPEVKGAVLQTGTENKVAAPPSATDKDLHQTATKESSFSGAKPEKAKEDNQPANAPARQQQLPQTNTLVPPPSAPIKNG